MLTYLGYKDTPAHADPSHWTPLAMAGREFADDQRCVTCHRDGASANPVSGMRILHDPEWLFSHVKDPQVIAPGLRPAPPGGMSDSQARSIIALMKKVRAGAPPPVMPAQERTASLILGRYCAACHMIDGEGASSAPDLTRVGAMRDAMWLRDWITSPEDGRRQRLDAAVWRHAQRRGDDRDRRLPGGAEVERAVRTSERSERSHWPTSNGIAIVFGSGLLSTVSKLSTSNARPIWLPAGSSRIDNATSS